MMRRLSFLLLLATTLQTQAFGQSSSATVMLEPGDKVVIDVWQRPELTGEFTVGLDGRILHPLYQSVRVTGVPADQVEGMVREFLSRFEANPQVLVQPLLKVAVVGAVISPEVHMLPPGSSVGQAVAAAGGVSPDGKLNDVRLRRKNGDESKLDLREASDWSRPVYSGDQITVRMKSQNKFRDVVLPILHFGGTIVSLVNILIFR